MIHCNNIVRIRNTPEYDRFSVVGLKGNTCQRFKEIARLKNYMEYIQIIPEYRVGLSLTLFILKNSIQRHNCYVELI